MGAVLEQRRVATAARIAELKEKLPTSTRLAEGKACVYATGSFARGEASHHSDLDLFIVGKSAPTEGESERGKHREPQRLLRKLDEICIKAELIECTKCMKIPEFSGDGEYLTHYTVHALTKTLGKPEDDVTNTFTARLLLLLESTPLVGEAVYSDAIEDVVAEYWGDFADHSQDFMPAFLANDILRIWRTFCVNYEARTEKDPPKRKAKRKLKNYKLKHSRLLTCYSALLYLLAVYAREGTVSPEAAFAMTRLSPTQRLEWLSAADPQFQQACADLVGLYEAFLEETDAAEEEMIEKFLKPEEARRLAKEANRFGDSIADLLQRLGRGGGKGQRFYRLLIV
jgi:predicted nucleotidyltransferase